MTLLGHNGAGKSTLIGYLLGFYNRLDQHPFLPHFAERIEPLDRRYVGYAPEAAWLTGRACADDYLALMANLRGAKSYDVGRLFARVGLQADPQKPIRTYSKGMKQRLLLAIALIGEPTTLVLDEPTSGLDPFGREEIESLLVDLAKTHKLIVCTHSLELAHKLGDEVWILCEGKIACQRRFDAIQELEETFFALRPSRID
ncbi:MAG: ABC transporter ATP-binding protein [Helicobacteraceae bacterium]|jgi:ABC-type multidrug transport system ATPase subunit|nr:ABC transporter ATP-binding protein [Helicobacteraceae bacterium]